MLIAAGMMNPEELRKGKKRCDQLKLWKFVVFAILPRAQGDLAQRLWVSPYVRSLELALILREYSGWLDAPYTR